MHSPRRYNNCAATNCKIFKKLMHRRLSEASVQYWQKWDQTTYALILWEKGRTAFVKHRRMSGIITGPLHIRYTGESPAFLIRQELYCLRLLIWSGPRRDDWQISDCGFVVAVCSIFFGCLLCQWKFLDNWVKLPILLVRVLGLFVAIVMFGF